MWWVYLVLVGLVWMLQQRWMTRRQAALAKQLKTKLMTYPIVGHSYRLLGTDENRMKAFQAFGRDAIEVGGISKFLHFHQLFACVADPVVAEILLSQCLEKHGMFKVLQTLIGDASIIAPVHIWRPRRKMNAPFFKTKNLAWFSEVFANQSTAMADLLEQQADKGTFSIWKYIAAYSMNTVCETTMGVTDVEGSQFSIALEELWEFGTKVISLPWPKRILRFIPGHAKCTQDINIVWNFITKIIQEKQNLLKNNIKQTEDPEDKIPTFSFLDLQLEESENSAKFTERELFEESLMLVGAGFDTSATAAAFAILMLGRYLDIQDKVYDELRVVFGDSDRAVNIEDLARLKYLEAVVKETLRVYPSVPVIVREVDKDVTLPSGITLVKGCGVLVNIWAVHRNPAYWGADADQFRPERFLDSTLAHPAAFMPFSYGPRNCIGYRYAMGSVKTMVCTLLRRYRVLAPPGVAQGEPLRTKFNMMLRHVDNYEIRLERRT